jgi:anti-anti-sigma regulatory factor
VHVEGDFFLARPIFLEIRFEECSKRRISKYWYLRMKNAHILDATCVLALEELINYMKENNRHLLISGVRSKIYSVIENSGILEEDWGAECFQRRSQQPYILDRFGNEKSPGDIGRPRGQCDHICESGTRECVLSLPWSFANMLRFFP